MDLIKHYQERNSLILWAFIAYILTLNTAAASAFIGMSSAWGISIGFFVGTLLIIMCNKTKELGILLTQAADSEKQIRMDMLVKRYKQDLRAISTASFATAIFWLVTSCVIPMGGDSIDSWMEINSFTPSYFPIVIIFSLSGIIGFYLVTFVDTWEK